MGNELGNQNASDSKGEEDEAIEGKENIEPAEDGFKGENNIIPEGESKDYHQKADLPACLSPDPKVPESVETEEDEEEPQNLDKVVEIGKEEELTGQDDHTVQKAVQGDEDNSVTCLQNGEVQTNDDDIKVEEKKPRLYEKDEQFVAYESTNISTQEPEGENNLSQRESEGVQEIISIGNIEETGLLIDSVHGVNGLLEDADFHGKQKVDDSGQETLVINNDHEKHDGSINDLSGGNNVGSLENGEFLPQTIKLIDSPESILENEEAIVLNDHTKLTNCEPAFEERNHEIDEIGKMAYSVPTTEPSQAKNEGENEVRINSKEATNGAFETRDIPVGDRIPEEHISKSQLYKEENILIVGKEELQQKHSETDITPKMPDSQLGNGEINHFENSMSEVQQINGRFSIQSNPEQPCNRIELRKCPSFDFGIPLDGRSEESDQTPFLHPPKSPFRSLSTSSKIANNRLFVNSPRGSIFDCESIVVGEKTIRVERSDSFHYIRKDDTDNAEVLSQRNDSNDSSMQGKDESGRSMKVELESSSPFETGTRKTRSSFFTTCLCCSTAIN